MKSQKNRMLLLTIGILTTLLFATFQSATGAGALQSSWKTDLLKSDIDESNISTVFAGPSQIPLISTTSASGEYLAMYYPYPGTDGVGPDRRWGYFYQVMSTMDMDHVSAVAEHTYVQSFVLSWVYVAESGDVYRVYMEFIESATAGIERIGYYNKKMYQPPSGYSVLGKPSHMLDASGNPHVAIVVGMDATPFTRSLIYIKEAPSTQSSCNFVSEYTCTTIQTRGLLSGGIGTSPKITVNSSYEPAILFYDGYTDFLTYAYPQSNSAYNPNCGPGDNTWRCVDISESIQSGSVFDSDIGSNDSRPQFAWSYEDTLNQTWMHHALFVGSGGNCGDDYYRNGLGIIVHAYRWQCNQTAEIGVDPYFVSTSIQVDGDGNAVIAVNSGEIFRLGVVYGNSDNTYAYQIVESGPINTGKNASLALSTAGRGFIAYIQDEEYSPNLRFALQNLTTFIPFVQR